MAKNYINAWEWVEHKEVESTNDEAQKLALAAGSGKKFVVTAQKQTKGRGRRGRSWEGLDGNLFCSFGVEIDLQKLGQLVFVIGLSLAETIKEISPDSIVQLKWPNDVLLNGKKVSGILLEKGDGDYFIVGVGVNIKASPKIEGLIYPATSLKEEGIDIDRLEFLNLYADFLDKRLEIWNAMGFRSIKVHWLKFAKGLGSSITVKQEKEDKIGRFVDVDDEGMLLIETEFGVERVLAGDIYF